MSEAPVSLVADCTTGDPWIRNTDPPAGGSLYPRDETAVPPPLLQLMSHRLHRLHRRVAQAVVLEERLIGERLVVNPGGRDGIGETHAFIQPVQNHPPHRRDDPRAP